MDKGASAHAGIVSESSLRRTASACTLSKLRAIRIVIRMIGRALVRVFGQVLVRYPAAEVKVKINAVLFSV